ncbi:hypothetical protein ACQ4PT_015942 [Festuca glaucescens]
MRCLFGAWESMTSMSRTLIWIKGREEGEGAAGEAGVASGIRRRRIVGGWKTARDEMRYSKSDFPESISKSSTSCGGGDEERAWRQQQELPRTKIIHHITVYDLAAKKGRLVVILVVVSMSIKVLGAAADQQVPAMYVFGDSALDVGNNNYLVGQDVRRANTPLNGIDYPGSRPTGRFSNGYNVADYIAKTLGFNESPPAYLSLAPRIPLGLAALTGGVSYASGDAGILDSTNAGNTIPLTKQLSYFRSTKAEMEASAGAHAVSSLLSRSFFLVGVGSNDMFVFAAAPDDAAAFYGSLIASYSAAITDLYRMGARKFGIINVGLIGCVPRVRALHATGACNDGLNQLAAGFDSALSSLLPTLAAGLPGLAYSLADYYNLTQATFANPRASGFANIDTACCGGGRLGAETDCLPNSMLCADRGNFVYWDRVHACQHAGEITAAAYYDGGLFTAPLTFKQVTRPSG